MRIKALIIIKIAVNFNGYYSVVWNGRDDNGRMSATGEYFVRMTATGYTDNIKISLIK